MANVVSSLGPGDLVTYGEVAAEAGYPGAARAVGTFLRTTELDLPWWRVLGAGGSLQAPDKTLQAELLTAEGVAVTGGKVRV